MQLLSIPGAYCNVIAPHARNLYALASRVEFNGLNLHILFGAECAFRFKYVAVHYVDIGTLHFGTLCLRVEFEVHEYETLNRDDSLSDTLVRFNPLHFDMRPVTSILPGWQSIAMIAALLVGNATLLYAIATDKEYDRCLLSNASVPDVLLLPLDLVQFVLDLPSLLLLNREYLHPQHKSLDLKRFEDVRLAIKYDKRMQTTRTSSSAATCRCMDLR